MNPNNIFITAILSATALVFAAITLDFQGALDVECGYEKCSIKLEKSA